LVVQLNGARIHYERSGSGLPLIMLHAGVADGRMWEPQLAAFEKHFDVVRPDRRGIGQSELPPGEWSAVADVLALMDELGLKPAHFVGCSMGGALAIDFALDHPERVSKLVLVGSGVSGQKPSPEYDHLFAEVEVADKIGDLDALNEAELHVWLEGPNRRDTADPRLRKLFLEMNATGFKTDWESAVVKQLDPPAVGRLGEITAPVLVVVGDEDLIPIQKTADMLASSIAGARKVVIHDAAHLPNLEHPEEFNRLVLDFLLS
jgi:pimeloyl-ACP methyl ester carboxylesterase